MFKTPDQNYKPVGLIKLIHFLGHLAKHESSSCCSCRGGLNVEQFLKWISVSSVEANSLRQNVGCRPRFFCSAAGGGGGLN